MTYDGGIKLSLHLPDEDKLRSPSFNQGEIVTINLNNKPLLQAKIIYIPISDNDLYTIRYLLTGDYDQLQESNILTLNNINVISTSSEI